MNRPFSPPPSQERITHVVERMQSLVQAMRTTPITLDPQFVPPLGEVVPVAAATPELGFRLGAAVSYVQRQWAQSIGDPEFAAVMNEGLGAVAVVVGALSQYPRPGSGTDPVKWAEGWVRDGQVGLHAQKPMGSPVVIEPRADRGCPVLLPGQGRHAPEPTPATDMANHLLGLVKQMESRGIGPPGAGGSSLHA